MSKRDDKWDALRAKYGAQAVREVLILAAEEASHTRANDDISEGDLRMVSCAQGGVLLEFNADDGRSFGFHLSRTSTRDLMVWLAQKGL